MDKGLYNIASNKYCTKVWVEGICSERNSKPNDNEEENDLVTFEFFIRD